MVLVLFVCKWYVSYTVRQRMLLWIKPRSRLLFADAVMKWDEVEWRRNFRISKPTFRFVCMQFLSNF